MRTICADEARTWLRNNGVSLAAKIEEIIGSFDFSKAVYLQQFEPGQVLYQFIRRSSAQDSSPMAGNWFCLKGARASGLAIIDGLSGRGLHAFRVARAFTALEGTAKKQPVQWSWSGGGQGGATQVYVPVTLVRACMIPQGAHEAW